MPVVGAGGLYGWLVPVVGAGVVGARVVGASGWCRWFVRVVGAGKKHWLGLLKNNNLYR